MAFGIIASAVAGFLRPVRDVIDELHVSEEEKALAYAKLEEAEGKLVETSASVIRAEAMSDSWLAASWRPIMMLSFLGLVYADSFGLLASKLAPEAWTLLQIGLGGYVGGRTIEKSVKAIRGA